MQQEKHVERTDDYWYVDELIRKYGDNAYADYETYAFMTEEDKNRVVGIVEKWVRELYWMEPEEFREAVRDIVLTLEGTEEATEDEIRVMVWTVGEVLSVRRRLKSGLGPIGRSRGEHGAKESR